MPFRMGGKIKEKDAMQVQQSAKGLKSEGRDVVIMMMAREREGRCRPVRVRIWIRMRKGEWIGGRGRGEKEERKKRKKGRGKKVKKNEADSEGFFLGVDGSSSFVSFFFFFFFFCDTAHRNRDKGDRSIKLSRNFVCCPEQTQFTVSFSAQNSHSCVSLFLLALFIDGLDRDTNQRGKGNPEILFTLSPA